MCCTDYDPSTTNELERRVGEGVLGRRQGEGSSCYGANDVLEGVATSSMRASTSRSPVTLLTLFVSSTSLPEPTRSGLSRTARSTSLSLPAEAPGRTLHPDNMGAGPASYGLTDSMGRMHGDAQFAGSYPVPAHVESMGLIGMGNNPMVGATVACAVAVAEGMSK